MVDEGKGTYSFIFTTKEPINWREGEHAVFTMPNHQVTGRTWRAFSIASSPNEGEIRIGTVILDEASDFKKKLKALRPGEQISMRGPFGEFHLTDQSHWVVGIAGGIGITPFRSILHSINSGSIKNVNIELIYAGRDNYFAYEEEMRAFAEHPNIEIVFVNTPDEVNAEIDARTARFGNDADYYISGSPGMIGAIRNRLQGQGIKKIFNDPFKGY